MENPATFHEAFDAARAYHDPSLWGTMHPSEQTKVISREMRRIDAERASIMIVKNPATKDHAIRQPG